MGFDVTGAEPGEVPALFTCNGCGATFRYRADGQHEGPLGMDELEAIRPGLSREIADMLAMVHHHVLGEKVLLALLDEMAKAIARGPLELELYRVPEGTLIVCVGPTIVELLAKNEPARALVRAVLAIEPRATLMILHAAFECVAKLFEGRHSLSLHWSEGMPFERHVHLVVEFSAEPSRPEP